MGPGEGQEGARRGQDGARRGPGGGQERVRRGPGECQEGARRGTKTRTLKQKVCQKHVPLSKKSAPLGTPEQLPSLRGHPLGLEENASFVILDEFSRVFCDVLDRTPKRRGVGER